VIAPQNSSMSLQRFPGTRLPCLAGPYYLLYLRSSQVISHITQDFQITNLHTLGLLWLHLRTQAWVFRGSLLPCKLQMIKVGVIITQTFKSQTCTLWDCTSGWLHIRAHAWVFRGSLLPHGLHHCHTQLGHGAGHVPLILGLDFLPEESIWCIEHCGNCLLS
jgi:hypothetical protein